VEVAHAIAESGRNASTALETKVAEVGALVDAKSGLLAQQLGSIGETFASRSDW
jgi:hypothetical protein